jgi:hypothetical protein
MKKHKHIIALVLVLALSVSLGMSASAATAEDDASKYISITPSTSPKANLGTNTLYYSEPEYNRLSSTTADNVMSYPTNVKFTIQNNHPTQSIVVRYESYAKQPDGKTWSFSDENFNWYTEDMSGRYFFYYDYGNKYWLSNLTDESTGTVSSAGEGLYWNSFYSSFDIEPGQSVTVSFDASMVSADVIYRIEVDYEDVVTDGAMTTTTFSYGNSVAFLLGDSNVPENSNVGGFTDVEESAYYADAVLWAVENGVTSGVSTTSFAPSKGVTRAEAVTFLWRAYGKPEPSSTTSPFTDVTDENAYYYKAVLWAAENGITTGISSTLFGLDGTLTFDQILTFLCRAAGGDASGADWSEKAINWAADNGVSGDMIFFATDNCPRSDVVYFLYNQLGC